MPNNKVSYLSVSRKIAFIRTNKKDINVFFITMLLSSVCALAKVWELNSID